MLKLVDSQLALQSLQHDWIDDWNLGGDNREYAGRFTQNTCDELLIRSSEWLGLLAWDPLDRRLRLRSLQHDWIDDWNLGGDNTEYIGDFVGDGLSEIYIRSPEWAGLFKWQEDRFRLLWIRHANVQPVPDSWGSEVPLSGADQSYVGRFMPGRDGIVHRGTGGVAVLTWEGTAMQVRANMNSWFDGRWNLGSADKFVLGDFHRPGPDVGDPTHDFITDRMTDTFIHNGWGTSMFGVNPLGDNPMREHYQIGLTWINPTEILWWS